MDDQNDEEVGCECLSILTCMMWRFKKIRVDSWDMSSRQVLKIEDKPPH